jgi:deoxyinosine 3'endonuclease (endonuclease V)
MFHALCGVCANAFIGVKTPERCERAWVQTYRAVDHRKALEACERCVKAEYDFPQEIQDFASYFVTMQSLRQKADYDPTSAFNRGQTATYVEGARNAISALDQAPQKHKKAFAAFVLLRFQRSES